MLPGRDASDSEHRSPTARTAGSQGLEALGEGRAACGDVGDRDVIVRRGGREDGRLRPGGYGRQREANCGAHAGGPEPQETGVAMRLHRTAVVGVDERLFEAGEGQPPKGQGRKQEAAADAHLARTVRPSPTWGQADRIYWIRWSGT